MENSIINTEVQFTEASQEMESHGKFLFNLEWQLDAVAARVICAAPAAF